MKVLIGSEVWRAIRRLNKSRASRRAVVITSYFGTGGAAMLPLRRGDVLVVAASRANVTAGLVNPLELLKYCDGVCIYSAPRLHGKLYIFGTAALIGSANVSKASASILEEIATQQALSASDVDAVVDALVKRVLSREDLRELAKIYNPPKGTARALLDKTSSGANASSTNFARPSDTDRVWYHGTFPAEWTRENPFRTGMPSMRRIRPDDWYMMVYNDPQKGTLATAPRRVARVAAVGGGADVYFHSSRRRAPRRAEDIKALVVSGAPPVKYNWQLISNRAPASAIFAAFGMRPRRS